MSDAHIVVCFEHEEKGFTRGKPYEVILVQDRKFLVIDEEARFVWVEPERTTPVTVAGHGGRIFDLALHRVRKRLEGMVGKPVVLTTWENLGFEPDEVNDEQMLVYRAVVESYDGETLFLERQDRDRGRFGVLPKAIATIEEEH